MTFSLRPFLALASALALATAHPAQAQLRTLDNYSAASLYPTDDGSSDAVDLGFGIRLFGGTYSSVFVNNNGNVTFDFASGVSNPFTISGGLAEAGGPILAPFLADVDTTYTDPVSYGTGTIAGRQAFVANWTDVASFGQTELRNTFQLFLVDRSDLAAGDFDFEFNYTKIQWDAGAQNQGIGALAGYSDANGTDFLLTGSGQLDAFTDSGSVATRLIEHQLGTPFDDATMNGRYAFNVRVGVVSHTGQQGGGGDPFPDPNPSPVPEPATWSLAGAGALFAVILRKRLFRC